MAPCSLLLPLVLGSLLTSAASHRVHAHSQHRLRVKVPGPHQDDAALLEEAGVAATADSAEAVVAEAEKVAAHEEASLEAQAAARTTDASAAMADAEVQQAEEAAGVEHRRDDPNSLHVDILRAKGLRFSDGKPFGLTDPYCLCEIPGKPQAKVQTLALDGLGGVHWNHRGEIRDYKPGDSLRCSVYDRDALSRDNFLGKTVLSSHQVQKGFKGEIGLLGAGPGVRAYLQLAVGRAADLAKAKDEVIEAEDAADEDASGSEAESESEGEDEGEEGEDEESAAGTKGQEEAESDEEEEEEEKQPQKVQKPAK